jgi:manganese/zinc/iron transport system substrate-binding protein
MLTGCDGGAQAGGDGRAGPSSYPYNITCTVGMISDITGHVAGEKATVQGIMGEGVDPHTYTPTTSDVQKLMGADAVFFNGLMLEGKMQNVLVKIARSGKPVHGVTEMLDDQYVMTEAEGLYDPHVWMDVQGWTRAVEQVSDALQKYDKANAGYYQKQAEAYTAKLELLDQYVKQITRSIPKQQRVLVTAHDAFNYFGRAYDIEVKGIQGLSTQTEASIRRINELRDMLIDRDIHAVFVETSVAAKNVKALIEGAQSKGHDVRIGGSLYSDAMGQPGTYEGTYIGMIDHNATTIARALGGDVPEDGFQGWLKENGHDIELQHAP